MSTDDTLEFTKKDNRDETRGRLSVSPCVRCDFHHIHFSLKGLPGVLSVCREVNGFDGNDLPRRKAWRSGI